MTKTYQNPLMHRVEGLIDEVISSARILQAEAHGKDKTMVRLARIDLERTKAKLLRAINKAVKHGKT